jgi:hypothetical protein
MIKAIVCSLFILITSVCNRLPHLNIPTEEIYRPIVLPPLTNGLSINIGPVYNFTAKQVEMHFDGALLPHLFSVESRFAAFYPFPFFEYLIIKNMAVQDSTLSATGTNLGLVAGIDGFGFGSGSGGSFMTLHTSLGAVYKKPLNNKYWLQFSPAVGYQTRDQIINLKIKPLFGAQLSSKLACTINLNWSYEYILKEHYLFTSSNKKYTQALSIPVTLILSPRNHFLSFSLSVAPYTQNFTENSVRLAVGFFFY